MMSQDIKERTRMNKENLFSYGTLQYEEVQLANFGRKLEGIRDCLTGFKLTMLEITDPDVIATSGEIFHPMITYTGDVSQQVNGMVFEVTRQELERADIYEVSDYKRVMVKLASGIRAWVYVHAATEVAL